MTLELSLLRYINPLLGVDLVLFSLIALLWLFFSRFIQFDPIQYLEFLEELTNETPLVRP